MYESGSLGFGSYDSVKGTFFLDEPLEVIAAIPGKNVLNVPCAHLVYKNDISWYIEMTEVIMEFIEYAMTLENPVLHWSS